MKWLYAALVSLTVWSGCQRASIRADMAIQPCSEVNELCVTNRTNYKCQISIRPQRPEHAARLTTVIATVPTQQERLYDLAPGNYILEWYWLDGPSSRRSQPQRWTGAPGKRSVWELIDTSQWLDSEEPRRATVEVR